jgi:hypothetical protein
MDQPIAEVILAHPDSPTAKEFKRLRQEFDEKPFASPCHGCGGQATLASAYSGNPHLMYWCDECDPYGEGANLGQLTAVRSFDDAMAHIDLTCNGVRSMKDAIIIGMAKAKGCPKRLTASAATKFLY